MRLVVYENETRAAATLHNEKSICAIGRDMVTTGRLHAEGCAMALEALARFRMLSDGLGVVVREAVATAAARDASNGADFVRRAEAAWGAPVRVLSARKKPASPPKASSRASPMLTASSPISAGGSLDMVSVRDGRMGDAYTLPFGPLRLIDGSKGDPDKARKLVDEGLAKIDLHGLKDRRLYAVGGIWRSFARVDMEENNYPLHVLQEYEIPRRRALRLCEVLAGLSRKSVEKMKVVSRRRAESLPFGAIVLERLLLASDMKSVVISAYGLREGLLFARLSKEERALDPLIDFAEGYNARQARAPGHAAEMFAWMTPLFADETPDLRRIRNAVCLFSDVAWRRHPDDRALGAFGQVLTAPYSGADHRARALIASAVSTATPATRISRATSPRLTCSMRMTRNAACAWGWPAGSPSRCRRPPSICCRTIHCASRQPRSSSTFRAARRPSPASRCRSGWASSPPPSAARVKYKSASSTFPLRGLSDSVWTRSRGRIAKQFGEGSGVKRKARPLLENPSLCSEFFDPPSRGG